MFINKFSQSKHINVGLFILKIKEYPIKVIPYHFWLELKVSVAVRISYSKQKYWVCWLSVVFSATSKKEDVKTNLIKMRMYSERCNFLESKIL